MFTNTIIDGSGTPGYMSPEAMWRIPHGPISDYFALGVIIYEMAFGKRPYLGQNKQELKKNMLIGEADVYGAGSLPDGWSQDALDFIRLLIKRHPQERLGFENGTNELKEHPWLTGFNWAALNN